MGRKRNKHNNKKDFKKRNLLKQKRKIFFSHLKAMIKQFFELPG